MAGARLELAELAVLQGRGVEARRLLDEALAAGLGPEELADHDDLRLRLALGDQPPVAMLETSLARLEASTAVLESPHARWRLELRRGQVLEAASDLEGARAAYERAERWLDEIVETSPFGSVRSATAIGYGQSARRLVEVQVGIIRREFRVDPRRSMPHAEPRPCSRRVPLRGQTPRRFP